MWSRTLTQTHSKSIDFNNNKGWTGTLCIYVFVCADLNFFWLMLCIYSDICIEDLIIGGKDLTIP